MALNNLDYNQFQMKWDEVGKKQYENGVKNCVLYKYDSASKKWKGYAWSGITSISESPDGAEANDLWADNVKYATLRSTETFGGSIEAYTYPEEFESCDGLARPAGATGIVLGQQKRETFRLCYRTEIGNDQDSDAGFKIHLVYNCTCSPSEKSYETRNDDSDAITFSWDFDTTPVKVTGYKDTSVITIDSTDFTTENEQKLTTLLGVLYGTTGENATDAYMPDPDEVITIIKTGSVPVNPNP